MSTPNAVADYSKISCRKENNWNEPPPANMVLKNFPFTKESLDYTKSTQVSAEIRFDRNVPDLVQVGVDSKGGISIELSDYSELFNTIFAAALFSAGSTLHGTPASGVLTSTANYANNETVAIGGVVYTFKTVLTGGAGVANEVFIGATEAASIVNLAAAINGNGVAGTQYGLPTTAHPNVTAAAAAHALTVTAIVPGTAANALLTLDTAANATWGAGTLTGGANLALSNTYRAYDVGNTTVFTATAGTPVVPPVGRAIYFQNLFNAGDAKAGIVIASQNANAPSTFTVSPALGSGGTQGVPVAVTNTAQYNYREISNGVIPSSFFIEKFFSDVNKSIAYGGMMVDSIKLNLDSRKIITADLNFMGGNGYEGTDITVQSRDDNTGNVLSASGNVGALQVGSSAAYIKTATIEIKNNLRGQDAIANLFLIGIGAGRCEVMLTFSAYFNSTVLFEIMRNHNQIAVIMGFTLGNYAVCFYMPRVKLSKALPDATAINTEVMLAVEGQALLDSVTGATILISNAVEI
jgi:hypothetical protein